MTSRQHDDDNPQRPAIPVGERDKVVAPSQDSFVQRNLPAEPAGIAFEKDTPRALIGHNAGRDAFFQAAREAERLEQAIAEIEQQQEQGEKDTQGRLTSPKKAQIIAAFDMAKPIHDGTVPGSVVDTYIAESGIRRHGNETVPFSALMRAMIAAAEIKTGAPKSKLKRARASSYASAIDFALSEGWSRERFIVELNWDRRKDERHGIEVLAAAGRHRRNAEKAAHATSDADASEPDAKSDEHHQDRLQRPAEPPKSSLGEEILKGLAAIAVKPGDRAVAIFRNNGPNARPSVQFRGPFSGEIQVIQFRGRGLSRK